MVRRILLGLALPCLLGAEPFISAVLNAGGKTTVLAPGAVANVYGSGFNFADPMDVNGVQVEGAVKADPAAIATIVIPPALKPGPATFTVHTAQGDAAVLIQLVPAAPGLYNGASSPFFVQNSIMTCEQNGQVGVLYARGVSAQPGQRLTVRAAGITRTPLLMIDSQLAPIASFTPAPGVSFLSFDVPLNLASGMHRFKLIIDGQESNEAWLPVMDTFVNSNSAWLGVYYPVRPVAPGSFVSAVTCGADLAASARVSDSTSPPFDLGGTRVTITDSAGVVRPAPLYFVSAAQVNYALPAETAIGLATVTITTAANQVLTSLLQVNRLGPGIFRRGMLAPAALLVRARNGVNTTELLPNSIQFGPADEDLYLVLFCTGLQLRQKQSDVHVYIGGIEMPVEYAGPQGIFALDQVNVKLTRNFAGTGKVVTMGVVVDGVAGNDVQIQFQ